MYKIRRKEKLAEKINLFQIEAPRVAAKAKAGQFVVLRLNEVGERIPLTIADSDPAKGTITIVAQEVGATTELLGRMKAGESILDLLGPLGHPTEIKKYGTVVCIGGGVGIAEIYPEVKAFKKAGNKVITIIGGRSKEFVIFEKELREVSDELLITTDDGSYGEKGFVSNVLEKLMSSAKEPLDLVIAVGPVMMMKVIADLTRKEKIKTIVNLNPIMLDATGMCGVCRVVVGGKTKFACVDGPEFDGHEVNFDELVKRLSMYKEEEKEALLHCQCGSKK